MELTDALPADGLVCAVGAGGKKTTLYALAERIERAVVTATVRIPIFDEHVAAVRVTDDPVGAAESADAWPLGLVPARERDDRYLGYDADAVSELAASGVADAVLVKADGARMRRFKAPGEREPQVPAAADAVLPVVSARVVGEPLTEERVHRPERVAALAGRAVGDPIRPEDVAAVLAHPEGGLKGVPADATVVPVVNMVDDEALADVGRAVARELLDVAADAPASVPRVVLTRMTDPDPVVDVVS